MYMELNDSEARVIGSLIEKSIVTPDQYPMTLNALTNACNQKSSRNPVMSLTQGEVQHAIRRLTDKHLVRTDENFRGRTEKYAQRFCNTRYSKLPSASQPGICCCSSVMASWQLCACCCYGGRRHLASCAREADACTASKTMPRWSEPSMG